MTADKTGTPTTVTAHNDRFTIAIDGRPVGFASFVDHDKQRIFHHTEIDGAYEGRGLASIVASEALAATRDAGLRIVAVCPMVADYLDKHHDFDDHVDPVTGEIERILQQVQTG